MRLYGESKELDREEAKRIRCSSGSAGCVSYIYLISCQDKFIELVWSCEAVAVLLKLLHIISSCLTFLKIGNKIFPGFRSPIIQLLFIKKICL